MAKRGAGITLQIVFYLVSAFSLACAVGVVTSRSVVYSAVFLLLSLLGVAGIFVLLYAEFLALVQVLLYGGAIVIVLFFGLMLTRTGRMGERLTHGQWPIALAAGLAVFGALVAATVGSAWGPTVEPQPMSFAGFSDTLFTRWVVPFEIASLVLLVALIGAIVIARPGGDPGGDRE